MKSNRPNTNAIDRRALLLGSGAALAGLASVPLVRRALAKREAVFIARGQRYDGALQAAVADGLLATGITAEAVRGRSVLLKPNLVEPSRSIPHMTTHPAMIVAAAEVFRGWGARVSVGEGPGHVRDTEMALVESGVQAALDSAGLKFADLNYEEVRWVENRGGASTLAGFYFPRSVVEADLVVSLPKMKTHHWAGLTGAMKNLFGVIPGIKYGWPKNVLHHHGIPQTVHDINASLIARPAEANSLPRLATIVDAIDCMEGDGPIMGSLKRMGLVVVGTNLPAVDATLARLMGLNPQRINYLQLASDRLGPLDEAQIEQRGEPWRTVTSPFALLDAPHLRQLREGAELVT